MKSLDVPVMEESKKAYQLFNKLEETMICIHYTNAVSYCIDMSIKNPCSDEGHFDINGFNNGKYDTEFLLEKLYNDSQIFFETYSDRFTIVNENVTDLIIEEYSKYEFSKQYKYLTLFVEYLNSKKLVK